MIDNHSSKRNINLVIGLGKSGFWAAKYLRSINKKVIVWESKDGIEFLERKTVLEELNIIVSLNKEFVFEEIQPFLKEIESVVVSPSIPYDHITIIELKKKGIKVIGEINVAWEILKDTNWIGITGTNGKTTVTHLLSHILCDTGLYAPFAGNIGTPLCKYAHSKKQEKIYDAEVLESSTFDENIIVKILIKAGRTIAKPALEVLEMALDPYTPAQVRVSLMAALAYLIMPFDLFPDFMPLVGFSDDFVALTAVLSIWSKYMTPSIRARAENKLNKLFPFY